jgi:hypothetical protein
MARGSSKDKMTVNYNKVVQENMLATIVRDFSDTSNLSSNT